MGISDKKEPNVYFTFALLPLGVFFFLLAIILAITAAHATWVEHLGQALMWASLSVLSLIVCGSHVILFLVRLYK